MGDSRNWIVNFIASPLGRVPHLLAIRHELPALVKQLDLKDIQIQQNPSIIARYFAFQWVKTNQTEVVPYWYETSRFLTNDTAQQKLVKISLITYPETPQNITEAENLLPFATAIMHACMQ